MKSLELGNP